MHVPLAASTIKNTIRDQVLLTMWNLGCQWTECDPDPTEFEYEISQIQSVVSKFVQDNPNSTKSNTVSDPMWLHFTYSKMKYTPNENN